MNKRTFIKWICLFVLLINSGTMNAQDNTVTTPSLTTQQQNIVGIAALTAVGDLEHLKTELNTGLNTGLTINEINEVLAQLYAYCGFPRSLNAITTFMGVLDERKTKGFTDIQGKEATAVTDSTEKYEKGRKVLEVLTKTPQTRPAKGFGEFNPRVDQFLKEHLFADIFESDVLTYQQRELATIAVLAAMPGVEPQLQAHLAMGINTGLSQNQLQEVVALIEKYIGKQQSDTAEKVLRKVIISSHAKQ